MRTLTLLLLFSFSLSAQTIVSSQEIKQAADELYAHRNNETPGAQVLVMQNGEPLYSGYYGLANLEHQVPVTEKTVFDLASIAKMFTGYAIASLAEEGQLDVNEDIRKYLPNFPDLGHKITVGHLLHHTSGIRNWTVLTRQANWSSRDRITYNHLLNFIYAQKGLDFTPGSRYQYSNSGYVLLAQIVEKVSGTPLPQWLRLNVFEPLEMDQSLMNDTPTNIIPHLAQGYYSDNNRKGARDYNNTAAPGSSSLISNAKDIQKWMSFLLHPPTDKQATIKRMFSPSPLSNGEENTYAYGIDVEEYRGTPYISHSGSWVSHTSNLLLLPEHNAAIFLAHNYRTNTGQIANQLAELFLPKEENEAPRGQSITPKKGTVMVSNDLLEEYLGLYKLGPGWYVDISRQGNKLYTKATSESKFPMYPIDEQTFVVPAYGNRTITFIRNDKGEIDAITYADKRRERAPEDTFQTSASEAASLLGSYYCHELGVLFAFTHEEGLLKAFNVKTGSFTLSQLEGDTYFADGVLNKILFHRDKKNQVTGFTVTNSRKQLKWIFEKAK